MSTYRQVTYLISDELKLASKDRYYELEHIVYLMDKYRAMILKQRYGDVRRDISESNFQGIPLALEDAYDYTVTNGQKLAGGEFLKSTIAIPKLLTLSGSPLATKITKLDGFSGDYSYVNRERFKSVGHNKWLRNQVYCTVGSDDFVYFKCGNSAYLEIITLPIGQTTEVINGSGVLFYSIFESPKDVYELDATVTDYLDSRYPLEDAIQPVVVDLVLKELLGALYRPKDDENNANDDLSNLQK